MVGVKFGSGKKFSNCWPTGLICDGGIMLPENWALLLAGSSSFSVSRIAVRVPLVGGKITDALGRSGLELLLRTAADELAGIFLRQEEEQVLLLLVRQFRNVGGTADRVSFHVVPVRNTSVATDDR